MRRGGIPWKSVRVLGRKRISPLRCPPAQMTHLQVEMSIFPYGVNLRLEYGDLFFWRGVEVFAGVEAE